MVAERIIIGVSVLTGRSYGLVLDILAVGIALAAFIAKRIVVRIAVLADTARARRFLITRRKRKRQKGQKK